MKKWLVTIAALWLAGCSSGEINKNYYQLPVVQSGTQSTASQGNRLLWLARILFMLSSVVCRFFIVR